MSNIIPPMLSSSPPPMDDSIDDNDDDDEFGDFAVANLSFDLPDSSRTPLHNKFTWNDDSSSSTPSNENINKDRTDNDGQVENCVVENDRGASAENIKTEKNEETQKVEEVVEPGGEKNGMTTESTQDNISQDSLVSGATDSGLCSASQNSGDASPVLHVEDDPLYTFPQSELGFKRDESSDSDKTLGNSVFENSVDRTFSDLSTVKTCSDGCAVNENNEEANLFVNLIPQEENNQSTSSYEEVNNIEDKTCSNYEVDKFSDFSEFQVGLSASVVDPSVSRNINDAVVNDSFKPDVLDGSTVLTNISEDDDDFGNFESVSGPSNDDIVFSSNSKENFSTSNPSVKFQTELEINTETFDSNSQILEQNKIQEKDLHEYSARPEANLDQFDDEFEDFEMAQVSTEHFGNSADSSLVFSKVQDIVKSLFPYSKEVAMDDSVVALSDYLSDNSKIWVALRDIELSHALTYQWAGSSSNKAILSALGIDSRNMLFGPRWNASVPRFAANLGFSPLEPVRALEVVSQTSTVSKPDLEIRPETSTSNIEEAVVPAAQFDWTSSGLVNPLDSCQSALLDLDYLNTFDKLTSSTSSEETAWGLYNLEKNVQLTEGIKTEGQRLVQELLSAKGSMLPSKPHRPDNLSAEAVAVLDAIPNLSFLQSKLLMFPVRESPQEISRKTFNGLTLD